MENIPDLVIPLHLFDELCRVCLMQHPSVNLFTFQEVNILYNPKFNSPLENVDLISIFKKYCNIVVQENDKKPQKICHTCVSKVYKAYEVFENFIFSDNLLNGILRKNNIEVELASPISNKILEITVSDDDLTEDKENLTENFINYCSILKPALSCENEINKVGEVVKPSVQVLESDLYYSNPDHTYFINALKPVLRDHSYFRTSEISKKPKKRRPPRVRRKRVRLPKVPKPKIRKPNILSVQNESDIFKCKLCKDLNELEGIKTVVEHLEDEHPLEQQCIICLKKFRRTRYLMYHLALHSKNSFVCKMCHLYFKGKGQLEEHNANYNHNNPLVCHICDRVFKSRFKRNLHMMSHSKEKRFQCSECGKCFIYGPNFRRHQRIHTLAKPFLCQVCGIGFTRNDYLEKHALAVHSVNGTDHEIKPPRKSIKCDYCHRFIKPGWAFIKHMTLHPEFTDFQCPSCPEIFNNFISYQKHMQDVHCILLCNICGKQFRKFGLKEHMAKHMEKMESKNRCAICDKLCKNLHSLYSHVQTHTDERPFTCKICAKRFKQASHLKIHQYQHEGRKPHMCDICGKAFSFKSVLIAHIRVHTGEKPYLCPCCGQPFRDTVSRHRHVKQKHPEYFEDFLKLKQIEYKSDVVSTISETDLAVAHCEKENALASLDY